MFTPLTTGQLAERLNVSRDTVRNYARDFAEFLSPDAKGIEPNARRHYTEKDALTLATIADLRSKGLKVEQVREALRNGQVVTEIPPAPSPAEKEARENVALVVRPEYERALDRIGALEAEKAEIREMYNQALITLQDANERIAKLEHELGVAKGQLSERLPVRQTLQITAVITIGMLVLVLIAVVLLAGRGGG